MANTLAELKAEIENFQKYKQYKDDEIGFLFSKFENLVNILERKNIFEEDIK